MVIAGVWDAVVTCFFIDTAHNIVEYIEIISRILKDGGVSSLWLFGSISCLFFLPFGIHYLILFHSRSGSILDPCCITLRICMGKKMLDSFP